MLKLNGYGGRKAKVNEKSQCFKGVGNFSYVNMSEQMGILGEFSVRLAADQHRPIIFNRKGHKKDTEAVC